MYQEYFRDSKWLSLPLIALVFFFAFFLVVLYRVTVGMRDSRRIDELASLPFRSEDVTPEGQEHPHG